MKKGFSFKNVAWKDVDWVKLRSTILKLQYRIYEASRLDNTKRLYWLQSHLINRADAKLYAVYLVIPRMFLKGYKDLKPLKMKGKKDAGVEKRGYTKYPFSYPFSERLLQLAKSLQLDGKSLPIRRKNYAWVEKAGRLERRPFLRIPTLEDRAKQALAKLALEPEWEAKLEPSSYGFRPGRSPHDAIEKVFSALNHGVPKEVYGADIRKCFDRIDHDALLTKLKTFPAMEKQVRAWLKAGVMEGYANTVKEDEIVSSSKDTPKGKDYVSLVSKDYVSLVPLVSLDEGGSGTPSGYRGTENPEKIRGIISPLLANIALNGLEFHLKNFVTKIPALPHPGAKCGAAAKMEALTLIRYADDLVVIHRNKDILLSCIKEVKEWFSQAGYLFPTQRDTEKGYAVSFTESREKITEPLPKSFLCHGKEGFDFLGFRVIQVKRKKGKYKVKIYPSRKNQAKLLLKVRKILQEHKAASSEYLIQTLRPVILGWGNVFKYCECSDTFNKLTHLIFQKIRAWVFRRDTRSGRLAIKQKSFPSGIGRRFDGTEHQCNWVLVGKKKRLRRKGRRGEKGVGNYLPHMSWIKRKTHVLIKGSNTPFDRTLAIYWSTRNLKHSPYPARISNLLKQQESSCPICKKRFDIFDSKSWEVETCLPKSQGGKDHYKNLQLLHKACHNLKTKREKAKLASVKSLQEPGEVKVSRPDLKTRKG